MDKIKEKYMVHAATATALAFGGICVYAFRKQLFELGRSLQIKTEARLKPRIVVVKTAKEWEEVSKEVYNGCRHIKLLGFDCEWVDQRPVALLQLATVTDLCVLLKLCHMSKPLPTSLVNLLANKDVLKVGVGCYDDAKRIFADHQLNVRGCVDLRYLVPRHPAARNLTKLGLSSLAKELLNVKLDKSFHIVCSDWEAKKLTERQLDYAAKDALVGVKLFMDIVNAKTFWEGIRWSAESDTERWKKARALCQGVVDVNYKMTTSTRAGSNEKSLFSPQSPGSRKPFTTRAYSTRQRPLYHNVLLLANDGQPLCTCGISRANWYIRKELAEVVTEEPFVLRLKFEPSGRPMLDDNYYLEEKENVCVACGKTDSYLRKNVLPHEYRRYFPSIMKRKQSHDVLLLCSDCHVLSNSYDRALRQSLALTCNAPIGVEDDVKFTEDTGMRKIRSAARALRRNCNIPRERIEELEGILKEHYGVEELSDELLEQAADLDSKIENSSYVPHGQRVVEYMGKQNGGLIAFEKMWRQHFLDTMKPPYLPKLWSVNHNHEVLAMKAKQKQISEEDKAVMGISCI